MKKVILITGCSSGIGLILAKRLAKEHTVYASMRNPAKLKETSPPFKVVRLDVTEKESIDAAMDQIKEKEGRLDVLVNNAGIIEMGFFEDVPEKDVRAIFETNFFGVLSVTKAALDLLHLSNSPKIVNISSTSGLMAMPSLSAYSASKWALEGFSESLRLELKPRGIDIVLIEPGMIRTELLTENFKMTQDETSKAAPFMKTLIKRWNALDPKKFLDPKDVCQVIEKKIEQKNPSFRQVLSPLSKLKLFIKRTMPYTLYERIVLKALGLWKK